MKLTSSQWTRLKLGPSITSGLFRYASTTRGSRVFFASQILVDIPPGGSFSRKYSGGACFWASFGFLGLKCGFGIFVTLDDADKHGGGSTLRIPLPECLRQIC